MGPRLCLVPKRGHHSPAGGLEERSEVAILTGRLLFGTGTPAFEPRPKTSSANCIPALATSGATAGPVATTTRSPTSRHARAIVISGTACDA